MSRLVLVRHGHAGARWGDDADPGLDDVGRSEALAVADALASLGPVRLVVSPLRRARETAAPLEARWGVEGRVDRAVGEIPSPTDDLAARSAWLAQVLRGTWPEADRATRTWRDSVVEALVSLGAAGDAVIVTHFVLVNVAVGAALGDDRVTVFRPGNGSRTTLDVAGGRLHVVELGEEASATVVR